MIKNEASKPTVKAFIDVIVKALTESIEKLEIKKNMCESRLGDETLTRLTESIVDNIEYMHPINELVCLFPV